MKEPDKVKREVLPIPDVPHVGLTTYDAKDPDTKYPPIEPLRPPRGAPNVLIVLIDDVGFGASSAFGGPCYTPTAERLAVGGLRYNRFHTTALCSPTRQALLTGRHAIRSGTHTAPVGTSEGLGLVAWERTLGDIFSQAGYATMCLGKWHVGEGQGRWPTNHGFDEWYGPPRSYDEALWETDPWYVPGRDPVPYMLDGHKRSPIKEAAKLSYELRRNVDVEYKRRAFRFLEENVAAKRTFLLYFNHSMLHVPVVPRDEYKGKSGNGDFADCLLELDGDFGDLLDKIDALSLCNDTIVVFAGDNGPEPTLLNLGTSGFFDGSLFTGMEGALRTPCIARWPNRIVAGRKSNEIFHITDWFTTLITMAGLKVPGDRVIDGKDQSPFLYGRQEGSNREGFLYWNGARLHGVKWRNFKMAFVEQRSMFDPAPDYGTVNVRNLIWDPKETQPLEPRYLHTWTAVHFGRLIKEFQESVKREPLIPAGAPLDFVPKAG